MFAVFQFTFPNTNEQYLLAKSKSEALRIVLKNLRGHELLLLSHSNGCDLYLCTDAPLPPKEKAWESVGDILEIRENYSANATVLAEKDAVSAFLACASGLRSDNKKQANVERFRCDFQLAAGASVTGPILQHLFQRSVWLHEKIRLETEYFRFATDEPAVFRELVGKIFGGLKSVSVLLAGSSPLLVALIKALSRAGSHEFSFIGDDAQFEALQQDLSFSPRRARNKAAPVDNADILLVSNTAADHISPEAVMRRMSRRKNAPLAVFSESEKLSRQFSEKRMYNVFHYTLADLEHSIAHNLAEQHTTVRKISQWIEHEVALFQEWLASDSRYQFAGMIGSTPEMQHVFELMSRIAQADITVLIQGESGTGKELVARGIHQLSSRADNPFVVVNCGAIPENLLESELFGHERGAFTGALISKTGLFCEANKGTIFLDEIGELPLPLQVKLLRFLQEGEIKAVGSNHTVKLDVRMLAATNRNLEEMLETGHFRSDLYFRLNVIQIPLPPLRDRKADIPFLAHYFLRKFSKKFHKDVREFSKDAMILLKTCSWPGNIRELENAIEHSVALCIGEAISVFDLPRKVQQSAVQNGRPASLQHLSLKEIEKKHILETIEACEGNYEQASRILGIGRTTLWRKLREYEQQNPS
jgi:transcriptional regulator with PAS, ATPase and Fis domain